MSDHNEMRDFFDSLGRIENAILAIAWIAVPLAVWKLIDLLVAAISLLR